MNGVKVVLATVGLILLGMVAWWVVKLVFGAAFYVIFGALVVGGGMYLYAKAKRPVGGDGTPRRSRR